VTAAEEPGTWRIDVPWGEKEAQIGLRRLIDQGSAILEWRSGTASLEEIFRRLTLGGE
jgi:hypothetical protein